MSLPEVLMPAAKYLISRMGPLWLLAIFVVGILHGLKPDEHTWPITVSYGMMQRDVRGVIEAVSVFAGALTLVWSLMSALTGQLADFLSSPRLTPYVDIVVGTTMVGVAAYLALSKGDHAEVQNTADYKLIWIHGLAAAFGGDFFIVLILTLALMPVIPSALSFLIGLAFGAGSWIAQMGVVLLIYKGILHGMGDWNVVANAGRIALGILGLFMIGLGLSLFFFPSA
ncbi:MAG: hypothetical protein ACP5T5_05960 [Thermoprotei archaeon]